ncbi:hypothetical protein [Haloferula sp. BvORR071]|uniref:hypothetical protein n=1 Tax=Haloferula sp. BvORR071 TaxID=1396141 RepID=UPI002240FBC4|nr:hypothetical protein [Haloferula sp. BvORR071]
MESLYQVIPLRSQLARPVELYAELAQSLAHPIANVFLGTGLVFASTSDGWLVGPFTIKNSLLVPTNATMRWRCDGSAVIETGDPSLRFLGSSPLGAGKSFPPTLADAAKRVLKVIAKRGKCSFLSRPHVAELSAELAEVSNLEEIAWLTSSIEELLPVLCSVLDSSDELWLRLSDESPLVHALQDRWTSSHSEKVGKATADLDAITRKLSDARKAHDELVAKTGQLSGEANRLGLQVGDLKREAETAFEDEVVRLAATPEKIAILSALLSTSPAKALAPVWRKIAPETQTQVDRDGSEALRLIGIAERSANEVVMIATAAFSVGQVVSIKSGLGSLIAGTVLAVAGHPAYWECDVPAGLLDPLPEPPESLTGRTAILLHGADRSDISLVTSGLRTTLLRQLAGGCDPMIDTVIVLVSADGLVSGQILPIGPCIRDELLSYSGSRAGRTSVSESIAGKRIGGDAMSMPEFEGLLPVPLNDLPTLRDPLLLRLARRFCNALQQLAGDEALTRDLFLAYWLLPRLESTEALSIIESSPELSRRYPSMRTFS